MKYDKFHKTRISLMLHLFDFTKHIELPPIFYRQEVLNPL